MEKKLSDIYYSPQGYWKGHRRVEEVGGRGWRL